jgi:lipopolysaccharide export system permease protein
MSGICAWFNLKVTPESRVAYKRLVINLGLQNPESLIAEDRFVELSDVILYVRKKNGDLLEDVCLYKLAKGEIVSRTTADKARVTWNIPANQVRFALMDGVTEELEWRDVPVQEPGPALAATNFLSTNVLQVLTNVTPGRTFAHSRYQEWHPVNYGSTESVVSLTNIDRAERSARISDMTFAQLRQELSKRYEQGVGVTPVLVQMHRQIAFSFAGFAFTLVAIPLGIRAHRRETSIGMAMSLVLVAIYYCFLMLAQALQLRERLHPYLIVWIPNLLFQALGIFLLWRANKKG